MSKYISSFLNSGSAECVINLFSRAHNSAKEITESYGLLETAKQFVPNLNNHTVIVVGDGNTPRTGALFAYWTKANVHSIDPQMNMSCWYKHFRRQDSCGDTPQRLAVYKAKIEDLVIDCKGRPLLVVWPHSHAPMETLQVINHLHRVDIAMPCCEPIPLSFRQRPHLSFVDENVLSPKNTIYVWGTV